MPARHKKPLARGFVNQKILESLLDGDKYGYEIIKEVKEKSNGKIELKQPSLYSSLKRFEQKGLISSYWGDSDIGGRRHYYTITEVGKNYYYQGGTMDDNESEDSPALDNADQLSIDTPTLTRSDVYDEVHGDFEIDAADEAESNDKYEVSRNDLSQQNKFLTDDILAKMKQQYQVGSYDEAEEVEEIIEKEIVEDNNQEENSLKEDFKPDFSNIPVVDQHIQQGLFETQSTESISNDEVLPNFEKIEELKRLDEPKEEENEIVEKKEIPLIQEKPINYHDWEDMKKQATVKKSFDMDETSIVSESTKQQYNRKIFLDQDERIDVSNNVNVSLNHKKAKEMQFYVKDQEQNKTKFEEVEKKDIDYKSILGELYHNAEKKTQNEYEDMVSQQLNSPTPQFQEEIVEQSHIINDFDIPKDIKIKYYEPTLKQATNNNFVKINKVNLFQSLFLSLFIIVQTLLVMVIQLTNPLFLVDGKLPLIAGVCYIIIYSAAILIPICTAIIYFINPNKQKRRFYLTKNFVWNGLIAMFACILLTVTINMLMGCRVHNWHNYFTQLFLPILLTTNFVLYPMMKGIIIQKVK